MTAAIAIFMRPENRMMAACLMFISPSDALQKKLRGVFRTKYLMPWKNSGIGSVAQSHSKKI